MRRRGPQGVRFGKRVLPLRSRGIAETQKGNVLQWIEKRNGEGVASFAAGCYAVGDAVPFPQPRLPPLSQENLQVQT
jgi:hypothetical protein